MQLKNLVFVISGLMMMNVFIGCGSGTDVVESGEYQGVIKEVEPDEREIYVTVDEDKTLELYFTEETQLTRQGEEADFSQLQQGQNVSVTVTRVGNRLDPDSVDIME